MPCGPRPLRWLLAATVAALASPVLGQPAAGPWEPAEQTAQELPDPLGGYCPVTLRDRHEWQPGVASTGVIFDGRRYQFAGARERDIFAAAPAAYAPALGGDCLVTWAETAARTPGRLDSAALYGDRLLLFADEAARRRFLEAPAQYADADLALGGRCAVSRIDDENQTPGMPEAEAVYQGLRYRFASGRHRSQFLANPERYLGPGGPAVAEPPASAVAAQPPSNNSPWSTPQSNGEPRPPSRRDDGQQDVELSVLPAMGGYCPVTLKQQGVWVRGRFEYRVDLGDVAFLTAGPEEKAALLKDPAAFMPVCGGECPVTLLTRGEHVRGSVFHAAEYNGRLVLLADAACKVQFATEPARYAEADVGAGGNCVVTLADQKLETPGLPQFAAWHAGKLYRFAGAEQLQSFLADPARYVPAAAPAP